IKSIHVSVYAPSPMGGDSRDRIARAKFTWVDRDAIRSSFQHSILSSSSEALQQFSMAMLDKWGDLRQVFISHAVRKGTGVWGEELGLGGFVFVEKVIVREEWKGCGLGKCIFDRTVGYVKEVPEL